MRKIILFLLAFSLVYSFNFSKPPKHKKSNKNNPYELNEIEVKPENLITSYQPSKTRYFDLLSTKLTITPHLSEKTLNGTAELLLTPHFYDQKVLTLDAKFMRIYHVQIKTDEGNKPLSYTYDSLQLKISLDRTYHRDEQFSVVIDYLAQPYSLDSAQSDLGRGMYFIGTDHKNPYKPAHMWSQGEEEANSIWFPTIDATNQRSSEEIFVTVDSSYLTLSNGLLLDSKNNNDGTRTDHWKQDKPHAPYLFFLAAGPYKKYATTWNGKEVSYYTFPKYFDAVTDVFKNVPEILQYYSDIFGVVYPWDKLGNIIGWDYTAGAMENTSAILYYDKMFVQKQDLIDKDFDDFISHEIAHQWFGDYVTCESWANVTLNESMADYSEMLWMEHKYGKDIADAYNEAAMNKYLNQTIVYDDPIVYYYFPVAHDLFDAIRYEKGGRVLNMLRNYVGDDAFFASLHKYLTDHKYSSTEIADLREAFEAITGEDLHWFFDQWWLSKGHPILEINHSYDEKNKTIELRVKQTQTADQGPVYRIPTKVDIYINGKKESKTIDITDREMAFYFPAASKPQLVNFDADKVLLCEKTDNLSVEENIFKFYNCPLYLDKREAIAALSNDVKGNNTVQEIFYKALTDPNWYLRNFTLEQINYTDFSDRNKLLLALQQIVNSDNNPNVRLKAFLLLCKADPGRTEQVCKNIIQKDSSLHCIAVAFDKLHTVNKSEAYRMAEAFRSTENSLLMSSLSRIFADSTKDNFDFIKKAVWLDNYTSFLSNFRSVKTFMYKCNDQLFDEGVSFLSDINRYEESDFNISGAAKTLRDLQDYFDAQTKEKKLMPGERDTAIKRLAVLQKAIAGLRSPSVEFNFY